MAQLDKMAQSTVKTAVHRRVISEIPREMCGDEAKDSESEDWTLPENLRRVQRVIH